MSESGSKIFSAYRSYGYIANYLPLVVRYIERRKENLVITAVGKSFLTFSCKKLRLLSISNPLPDDIDCITADNISVFTASKCVINSWKRGTEVKHTYKGHDKTVHLLFPFGPHLISVDEASNLKVWDIGAEELYLELSFNNDNFQITTIVHPATYVNKIVIGSQQGQMQLWNLKSAKLLYNFKGWDSPITVLEQAPAVDVIAVGLADGRIIVHNLRHDRTVMKFMQDWGPVTALSFRRDGEPMLVSGSSLGHMAVWNLEEKRLHTQMREAHHSTVVGIKFLPSEPLMVTSSVDNSLKVWIFDMSDGGGRLLYLKDGHSAPPTRIRFYGSNGEAILSAAHKDNSARTILINFISLENCVFKKGEDSTLRIFSTVNDLLHRSLGKARKKRKNNRKRGTAIAEEASIMPPIVELAWDQTREQDWDNVVACHHGSPIVTTWSFDKCKMGTHRLKHTDTSYTIEKNVAKCVAITPCGNFVLIGFQSGHVDKFNLQSGEFRGRYGEDRAHDGSVRGIVVDGLNQIVITIGMDKKIKFWRFKAGQLITSLESERTISKCLLHRESSLLAMASDDFSMQLLDIDTKRIVRKFIGCAARITDFDFSSDLRWLTLSSVDCTIRTWDIPSSRMIDCFLVDDICTALSMSPTGEYLATTHVDKIEIFLWVNRTLFTYVQLSPLPSDYEPQLQALPKSRMTGQIATDEHNEDAFAYDKAVFKSPQQISDELVTLSLLPDSRWKNLLVLDVIKKRNKPKEPPKVPKAVPFFIPTVPGLTFQFSAPQSEGDSASKVKSRFLTGSTFQTRTAFGKCLEAAESQEDYFKCLAMLKEMGGAAIEVEIYTLSPEGGGSLLLLDRFMKMLGHVLQTNRDFEAAQAYLGLFLKIHGSLLSSETELMEVAVSLQNYQTDAWDRIQTLFLRCQSVISFLKSAPL